MKIDISGRVAAPGAMRRTTRGQATGDAFSVAGDDLDGGQATARTGGLAPLTALYALQEVPDATARRGRALRRGHDLLDRLEELRMALLSGSLSGERLQGLLQAVRSQRENVADPRLAAILDEVELRAAVELAKLGF